MIPITIITGFLGSGKTSLVAHLLDSAVERRIGVIVNDLATESIDTAFLHGGEYISMKESKLIRTIAGGRVGAGKQDELVDTIAAFVTTEPPIEAIVIETSGSSPVLDLGTHLSREPRLKDTVRLDSIIAMVDTGTFGTYWKDPQLQPLLADQIAAADLVVLNKSDRARFWDRRRGKKIVRKINPAAHIGTAEFGRLPFDEIIATRRRGSGKTVPAGDAGPAANTGASVPSVSPSNPNFRPLVARFLREDRPFHPQRLDTWLNSEWHGIIRVKGFAWLATDMVHVYVIDIAGPQREVGLEGTWNAALPADEVPDDQETRTALEHGPFGDRRQGLTVIGLPNAVERELRNLRSCLLSDTEFDQGPRGWSSLNDPINARFAAAAAQEDEEARQDEAKKNATA